MGLPCLDPDRTPACCPFCRQAGVSIDVLLHMSRCGRSPCFHTVHAVLAHAIRRCCEAAGATDADLRGGKRRSAELRGLRSDGTRPGDVAWLHYHGRNRHLLIDATVASVFCLAMLKPGCFDKPGLAAAKAEARKFSHDAKSVSPVGGQHRLVPFAVEEPGRFGRHAACPCLLPFSARLQIGVSRMALSSRPPPGVPPNLPKWPATGFPSGCRIFLCHSRITCPRSSFSTIIRPCLPLSSTSPGHNIARAVVGSKD